MPRPLPLYGDDFESKCRNLIRFSQRLERNHIELTTPNAGLKRSGLELSYELLFLKIFLLWENFQQEVFLRLMMGYESNGGVETFQPGVARSTNLQAAETSLLRGRQYLLWHDPNRVVTRSDRFFAPANSHFRGVIGGNQASLSDYSKIRHQIAHSQNHARQEFDNATMRLSGRRYSGNAGRFLRDTSPGGIMWLEHISTDLSDICHQIC